MLGRKKHLAIDEYFIVLNITLKKDMCLYLNIRPGTVQKLFPKRFRKFEICYKRYIKGITFYFVLALFHKILKEMKPIKAGN